MPEKPVATELIEPVLVGLVAVPPIWVMVWTGCSLRLPLLWVKNQTEPDLKTLNLQNQRIWMTMNMGN